MSKPILAGVIVVALAAGVGGYAVMAGAPAAPKGGCPALVSMAPYDANFIAYGDFATMRNSSLAQKMNPGANKAPLPKEYQDFVAQTNFHIESDLVVGGTVSSRDPGVSGPRRLRGRAARGWADRQSQRRRAGSIS